MGVWKTLGDMGVWKKLENSTPMYYILLNFYIWGEDISTIENMYEESASY